MSKKIILLILVSFFIYNAEAQLVHPKGSFSRADSLRGFLSPLRTCFDIKFYDLTVKIDPEKKSLEGLNRIRFKILSPTHEIQLDLFSNMVIRELVWNQKKLTYRREYNAVFISFPEELKKDSTYTLDFSYYGKPQTALNPPWDGGFSWSRDSSGKPWVGVSCQGTGASLWWPNKDHQSDEPDSMMIRVQVPGGLKDISNGRLVNTVDMGDGTTRFDWFVRNPINNYDVTLNIGDYVAFSEDFQDLTCDYYVLPEHLAQAKKQFTQVKTMLITFVTLFGPYPFIEDGYKLVESPYLGMEHQSAVAYGNRFRNGYMGTDLSGTGFGNSWDYIIVHESAHEWFGNNITSNDIADMWIHEAFAMYAEGLFVEFNQNYASGQKYLYGVRSHIRNDKPIIGPFGVNQEGSDDMYYKGAAMLNTIRHIINSDSLWFSILKKMNLVFRHKTVDGKDIINFICTESHLDLRPVFHQYLSTTQVPRLEYRWENNHTLKFKWTYCAPGFTMPVDLVSAGNKPLRVYPVENNWNFITLSKNDYKDLKPDILSFYIDVPNSSN